MGSKQPTNYLRNYWIFSAVIAIVWAIALIVNVSIKGWDNALPIVYVFLGYALGWIVMTIARYIYPPPARWGATGPNSSN